MSDLVRFWATFDAPVTRRDYRRHGFSLIFLKYAGDAAFVHLATGTWWTPLNYFTGLPSMVASFAGAPSWLMPSLAMWALPFIWIGVTLTARRAYDAGWSPWWAMLFFLPVINYVLMLVLCTLPTAPRVHTLDIEAFARGQAHTLLISAAAGVAIGVAMVALASKTREYGLAIFIGTPFAMGAATGFLYNALHPSRLIRTIYATLLMLGAASGVTMLLGVEGLFCILMASPLIIAVALMGCVMGRQIALRYGRPMPPALLALLVVPMWSALEPADSTGRVLHEVQSAVEIAAPPDRVWSHVIQFSPMTSSPELVFRLGIAEPLSARVDGNGVGAVRYCTFSTGAFVEPITGWEPARRLAFDVTSSPAPLRELSPYSEINPPHLHGYLRSRRGEFRLIALPNGGTRLEGRTWYELQMAPEGYWQLFSDYLIHAIHRRVLTHIKDEAESTAS